jgi:hypothetical protein
LTGGSANSFNGLNRKLKKRPQQPFPLRHAAGFDAEGLLIVSDKQFAFAYARSTNHLSWFKFKLRTG